MGERDDIPELAATIDELRSLLRAFDDVRPSDMDERFYLHPYNAVNLVIKEKGGVSAVYENKEKVLGLPVAGLMSNDDGYKVAAAYTAIDNMVKSAMGSTLTAPFMTLSFMALLVIPHLKLSDLGLFDGDEFTFVK